MSTFLSLHKFRANKKICIYMKALALHIAIAIDDALKGIESWGGRGPSEESEIAINFVFLL